jgi:hypothetical protein
LTDVDRPADAANLRRRIERRTNLVMDELRFIGVELAKDIGQLPFHFGRSHRATITRNAESPNLRITLEHFGTWRIDEQNRFDTAAVKCFEYVGRAREIVAVIGEEQVDGRFLKSLFRVSHASKEI